MLTTKLDNTQLITKNTIASQIPMTHAKVIEGELFVEYEFAMGLLGKSTHIHQLEKKRTKYPHSFQTIGQITYIDLSLLELMHQYGTILQNLQLFRTPIKIPCNQITIITEKDKAKDLENAENIKH